MHSPAPTLPFRLPVFPSPSLTPALTHCSSSHPAQDEALRKLQRKLESLEGLLRQHPLARVADLRPRLEALLHKQVGAAAPAGGRWPPQQAGGWLQRGLSDKLAGGDRVVGWVVRLGDMRGTRHGCCTQNALSSSGALCELCLPRSDALRSALL